MDVLQWTKREHSGVSEMDETHAEFIALVNAIGATRDAGDLRHLLRSLVEHTRAHFALESKLMSTCDFPAVREHEEEHARVLGDLSRYAAMADRGMPEMAKAFVCEYLPAWFRAHAATMDSALARCVKEQRKRRSK